MDRYEKIRVIGQGAFGKVFLCRGRVNKQQLVIKQIPLDEMKNVERKAARNESDVLSILKHPNIIAYFHSFVEEKNLMIVMEYAPGGTLFEFLQERNGVLMEEEHIRQFFVQLLVAIEHVHSLNILHRDLKTQNIMLNKKKNVLKIGDFGISKILNSKITSAQTVVGTPCYISPEICEGKAYAKKSDIWALGCILYEMITLQKAFEGPNLPALVMKIMQASSAIRPMETRYSKGLRDLVYQMLQRYPDDRPDIHLVMANPVLVNALMYLCMDIGRLPCRPYYKPDSGSMETGVGTPEVPEEAGLRSGLLRGMRQRSFFEDEYSIGGRQSSLHHSPKSLVYMWGNDVTIPLVLPAAAESRVVGVACGRSQKAGVTEDGKLFVWESSMLSSTKVTGTLGQKGRGLLPTEINQRFLTGESSAVIKKVDCGDMYTACLTDKAILLTFGSGISGALGCDDYVDSPTPKMVPSMLDHETIEISCGANHMIAITADQDVFSWGRGANGQLGVGNHDSYPSPQRVHLHDQHRVVSVCCGTDCSILLTSTGRLLGAGSNKFNKLSLDTSADEDPQEEGALQLEPGQSQSDRPTSLQKRQNNPPPSPSPSPSPSPLLPPPSLSFLRAREGDGKKPAILNLFGDSTHSQTSTFVMSSLKPRKPGSDSEGSGVRKGRRVSVCSTRGVRGRIDETLVFKESGSDLVKERKIVTVAMGMTHTAMVTDTGEVITTGDNAYLQLGYRKEKGERQPAVVEGLAGRVVRRVACGDFFTTVATEDHEVLSWGRGKRGRLGRETEEDSCDPQPITFEGPHSIQAIVCYHGNTLLLTSTLPV